MTVIWKTKFGLRAVRHEPPGIKEALDAAEGFCSDREQQIEIAAALLGAELDEVRAVARAVAQQERRTLGRAVVRRAGVSQAVVVERRRVRRSVMA